MRTLTRELRDFDARRRSAKRIKELEALRQEADTNARRADDREKSEKLAYTWYRESDRISARIQEKRTTKRGVYTALAGAIMGAIAGAVVPSPPQAPPALEARVATLEGRLHVLLEERAAEKRELQASTERRWKIFEGQWRSTDPSHRFTLDCSEHQCRWTERGLTGRSEAWAVPLLLESGRARLERPNDSSALALHELHLAAAVFDGLPAVSALELSAVGDGMEAVFRGPWISNGHWEERSRAYSFERVR